MSEFQKYQHIERINSPETEGLLDGVCHVFYKIDGTNASVWWDPYKGVQAGSRNRDLMIEGATDNAGFRAWVCTNQKIYDLFCGFPELRLYGEWLVPHSLKTYRDDAWRRFYVFDVYNHEEETMLPYDRYKDILDTYELDYIPPLAIIKKPNGEDLLRLLEKSGQFLVKDGEGGGEGIVVKNYDYVNKFGRQTWGKMITNEFKEKHHKEMGAPEINSTLLSEEVIVRDYLTDSFILKEQAKIANSAGGDWSNSMIPELLGRVWYEFIREETYNWMKDLKNPTVNFRLLNSLVLKQTKKVIGL